eukprot:gene813-902_t
MTVEERAAFLEEVQTELGKIAELKGTSLGELMYDFKEEENSAATAAAAAAAESAATTPTPPVSNGPKIASKLAQALTTEHKPAPPAPVAAKKLPTIPNVFAVVCDTRYERAYPWGTCEIRNEEHSDFLRLQYLIFEAGMHIKGLRDVTQSKTIMFLDHKEAFEAEIKAREEAKRLEEERKVSSVNRLQELEKKYAEEVSLRTAAEEKLKALTEESARLAANTEVQLRAEREAKNAATLEAKARADEAKRLMEAQTKLKEDLQNANTQIAKLRSERDAEARKAQALTSAAPPPVPVQSPPPVPAPAPATASKMFLGKR